MIHIAHMTHIADKSCGTYGQTHIKHISHVALKTHIAHMTHIANMALKTHC